MSEDAKSAERQRLAAALRANLRRRKAATRPGRHDQVVEPPRPEPPRPEATADHESKG